MGWESFILPLSFVYVRVDRLEFLQHVVWMFLLQDWFDFCLFSFFFFFPLFLRSLHSCVLGTNRSSYILHQKKKKEKEECVSSIFLFSVDFFFSFALLFLVL